MFEMSEDQFCKPTEHSFVEHSKSGKIYCTKCSNFLGSGSDIANQVGTNTVPPSEDDSHQGVSVNCSAASHAFCEHSKSGRLFCSKCGIFTGGQENITLPTMVKAVVGNVSKSLKNAEVEFKKTSGRIGESFKHAGESIRKIGGSIKNNKPPPPAAVDSSAAPSAEGAEPEL